MKKFIATFVLIFLSALPALAEDPALTAPLWDPLGSDNISTALKLVACSDAAKTPAPADCKPPLNEKYGAFVLETGRVTGLLEACGAPDRNIYFNRTMTIIERTVKEPESLYFAATLHGFARGQSRNGFVEQGLCQHGDPDEAAHYLSLARRHFEQYVLPLSADLKP